MPPKPGRKKPRRAISRGPVRTASSGRAAPLAAADDPAAEPDASAAAAAFTSQAAAPAGAWPLRVIRAELARSASPTVTVRRDYGYVRGELLRIGLLAAAILAVIGLLAAIWN